MFAAGVEEEAVVADAPEEHAPPFLALERFPVALEWVGGHLDHDARDTFLVNSQTQLMFDLRPGYSFPFADLFEGVAHFRRLGRCQGVVGFIGKG